MIIVQKLVSPEKYNIKCPYSMTAEFYVVHNTANDATAANEIAYMARNDAECSFHYAIDDKEIVQGIPENRNAWHAGDGGKGNGNRKGIGIEICYSRSGGSKFVAAEKLAAKFIARGLKEKGWGIDKVKKHQDFDGKYCPHRTLDMGWQRFLNLIKSELTAISGNADNPDTLYRVQVGAYALKKNAEAQLKAVKNAGFDTYMVQADGFYKIQVGAFSKKENADNMLKKVTDAGFYGFITTTGGTAVTEKETATPEIKVGSWVKVKQGAKTVDGVSLASFVYNRTHDVTQVKTNSAVIAFNGVIVAEVNKADLIIV